MLIRTGWGITEIVSWLKELNGAPMANALSAAQRRRIKRIVVLVSTFYRATGVIHSG
jgi:hypothetical protein